MLNFRLIAQTFCASKFQVPTTFNADICSLALVHYADNSHHSCSGPTFVCLEAMLAKMLKTFLGGLGKKIITSLILNVSN